MSGRISLLLPALALTLWACSEATLAPGTCRSNRDCGDGQSCLSGQCQDGLRAKRCTSDETCPLGQMCDLESGACVQIQQINCTSDDMCPLNQRCNTATGVCTEGLRPCSSGGTCPSGRHCDTSTDQCVECTEDGQCTGGKVCRDRACTEPETMRTDAGTVTPGPDSGVSNTCSTDQQCGGAPDNLCVNGRCAAGCHRFGGITCNAVERCEPTTGRCVQAPPMMCANDMGCAPPASICEQALCVPGCGQPGGTACGAGTVCDQRAGRCVVVSGPCMADSGCSPPNSICEGGQCIGGCGQPGGLQCSGNTVCNAQSGRCDPGGAVCLSDLDCGAPARVCELSSSRCVAGCTASSCAAGTTCDTASGHCRAAGGCMDDRYEQNDSSTAATPLMAGLQQSLGVCPGDDDYYAIMLAAGEAVTIDVRFQNAEGNIDVELKNAAGMVVASGTSTDDDEQITFTAMAAGTYQIRVFLVRDLGPRLGNTYTLSYASQAPSCAPDPLEENDTQATATQVMDGIGTGLTVCTGDDDFYTFQLGAGESAEVTLVFSSSEGDIDLELLDAGGMILDSSYGIFGIERVNYTARAAGPITARVFLASDGGMSGGATYSISVAITAAPPPPAMCMADALEENDTRATARVVAPGTTQNLTICPMDDDYYAVDLAVGDTLVASTTFTAAEGDIDMALFDPSGASVATSAGTGGSESVRKTATMAGRHAVRVFLYNNNDPGSRPGNTYAMTVGVTLSTTCPVDRFEPNNTMTAASAMVAGAYPVLGACPNNADYYRINAARAGRLVADIKFRHAEGDIDAQLLDASGTRVALSESTDDDEQIAFDVPAAGMYTLYVYLFMDTGTLTGNRYDLTVTTP